MGGRRDDSAPGPGPLHAWLVLGLLLAALATAAVFFVEPLLLRIGLLAVCWAFLIAALLAGRRRADQVAAAAREAELRHAYELELELEVAARHEYEVELESRLRQETEDAMREELAQLRTELAALTEIRGELAGLAQLRTELAGLGTLRDDLARMRTELTEQLSGELLIERMVMRAQSVRGPAAAAEPGNGRTLEGPPSWDVDRWGETRVAPAVPVEAAPVPVRESPPVPPPFRPTAPVEEPPSPLEWLGSRPLLDADRPTGEPVTAQPAPTPRRHHRAAADDAAGTTAALQPSYDGADYDDLLFGSAPAVPAYEPPTDDPTVARQAEPRGHARLEQILAERGVEVPAGGRSRRRRHRDEDDGTTGDDVLARLLGR